MLNNKQRKISNKWKKLNIKITREMRDIIHGYIMGDGYLRDTGSLQVNQGEKQEAFVNWLYEKLSPIRTKEPVKTVSRYDKRTKKTTHSKRFFSKNVLVGFHKMWYNNFVVVDETTGGSNNYTKKLPKNIYNILNPTVISTWFASDGTLIRQPRSAKIEVSNYTKEERKILQEIFLKKFKIQTKINRAGYSSTGKPQWTLNIVASYYPAFRDLLTQYTLIPTIFSNKLHPIN